MKSHVMLMIALGVMTQILLISAPYKIEWQVPHGEGGYRTGLHHEITFPSLKEVTWAQIIEDIRAKGKLGKDDTIAIMCKHFTAPITAPREFTVLNFDTFYPPRKNAFHDALKKCKDPDADLTRIDVRIYPIQINVDWVLLTPPFGKGTAQFADLDHATWDAFVDSVRTAAGLPATAPISIKANYTTPDLPAGKTTVLLGGTNLPYTPPTTKEWEEAIMNSDKIEVWVR